MALTRRYLWILLILSRQAWAAGIACAPTSAPLTTVGFSSELPAATVGTKYLAKADVSLPFGESVPPLLYSCTAAAGAWLQVDEATGALSGQPAVAVPAGIAITVSVRDSAMPPHSTSQDYVLRIQETAREIQLIPRIVEGTTLISGVATPSAKVRILEVGETGRSLALPLQSGDSAPADASSGVFTAVLVAPLYGGQIIQIEQQSNTGIRVAGPLIQVPGLSDWGRVRAAFTAGIVLSYENQFQSPNGSSGNSSQSTLFLGLDLEKNWKWQGLKQVGASAPAFTGRLLFTSYFDVQLTSVPVVASTGTDSVRAFLTSAKSAEIQGGFYIPILISHWNWQNAPNALFVAPVAKVGFITPTGPVTEQAVNPAQFYNLYELGARMGHFKLSANSDSAPEAMSYIDVVAGRFSNLDTLAAVIGTDGSTITWRTRRWRIGIEGVMKLPASPFVLGFDANVGQKLTTPAVAEEAKDDLRFFIGAKFDVGKMIGKLQRF